MNKRLVLLNPVSYFLLLSPTSFNRNSQIKRNLLQTHVLKLKEFPTLKLILIKWKVNNTKRECKSNKWKINKRTMNKRACLIKKKVKNKWNKREHRKIITNKNRPMIRLNKKKQMNNNNDTMFTRFNKKLC